MKSLQTKLLTICIGAMVLLAFTIGGIGIYTTKAFLDTRVELGLETICNNEKEQIDKALFSVEKSVEIMEAHVKERMETAIGIFYIDEYQEEFNKEMEKLFLNVANQTEGCISFYLRYNPEYASSTAGFFWNKPENSSKFKSVPPTDIALYEKDDIEHVGWYYIPVENGRSTWVMPYENKNIDRYLVSYVTPLYKNDYLVGVIGMDIDFMEIMNRFWNIKDYKTSFAYLVDSDDNIIYHKDIKSGLSRPEIKKGNHEEEVQLHNGMKLVISVSEKELYSEYSRFIATVVLATLIILILTTIILVVVVRKMIYPLIKLTEATMKVEEGEWTFELEYSTNDEIGILTKCFKHMVAHMKENMDYINALAYLDALTSCKNATAYREFVEKMERKIKAKEAEFAVVVADLNRLKYVNDVYGHESGNDLIIAASKVLGESFKRSPLFRIGGDEFALILEGKDYNIYPELLEKFEIEMNQTYIELEEQRLPVKIALGISVFNPETDQNYNEVFQRADDLMYKNKAEMKRKENYGENR